MTTTQQSPIKRRVLILTTEMSNTGVPNFILNTIENLDREKFQFGIVNNDHSSSEKTALEEKAKQLGVEVFHLPPVRSIFKFAKEFSALVKNYDVFHSHFEAPSFFPLLLAKNAGIKNRICTADNIYDFKIDSLYKLYIALTLKQIPAVANLLNGISEFSFRSLFKGIDFENFSQPQGWFLPTVTKESDAKFNLESRNAWREKLGVKEGTVVLGSIGRLNKEMKNQGFLIEALSILLARKVDCKLVLVGSGEDRTLFENRAKELKVSDSVIFTGALSDTSIQNAFDIYCHPSTFEGLGIVVVEAQANGLPTILSPAVPKEADWKKDAHFVELNCELWAEAIQSIAASLPKQYEIKENRENSYSGYKDCVFFPKNAIKIHEQFYLANLTPAQPSLAHVELLSNTLVKQ